MEISFIASYNSYYDGYNSTLGGDCNPSNNPDVVKKRTEKILNSPLEIEQEYREIIAKNISTHMGQWNTDYKTQREILPLPKTKMQNFVHICDYLASRKCLEFNFDCEL